MLAFIAYDIGSKHVKRYLTLLADFLLFFLLWISGQLLKHPHWKVCRDLRAPKSFPPMKFPVASFTLMGLMIMTLSTQEVHKSLLKSPPASVSCHSKELHLFCFITTHYLL